MKRPFKKKWYEKYLPFVARSVEKQVEWLVSAFNKGNLTNEEIAPYISLILAEDNDAQLEQLISLFNELDSTIQEKLFLCADVYDVPKLFQVLKQPTVDHALIALRKLPPPYEKSPQVVFHRVFQAIHDNSADLLEEAAKSIGESNDIPEHFEEAYERFQEIIEDEKLLSSLYPKAKGL